MRIILSLIFTACLVTHVYAEVYVLCYHTFLDKKNVAYDFSREELKSHLKFLGYRGFRFISLKDIQEGRVAAGKNVLVTIDDGNHSVYRAYYDVFRPLGVRPVLTIYPNIIGKKDYALTWQQLKQLSADGCDIGAHGYFHLKINKKLHDENKRYFMQEIVKSKQVLEEKLGITVTSFFYPFGLATDVAEEALRGAGYTMAFTIVNNPVKFPLSRNRNPMRLPRYMLTRSQYQGSLNHIASIASRGERAVQVAGSAPRKRESVQTAKVVNDQHDIRSSRKPVEAMARSGRKRHREGIRMGVAYADQRNPEKAAPSNGGRKKKKAAVRKKEITTAPARPAEAKVMEDLEVRRQAPADQVFQYNLAMGTQRTLSPQAASKGPDTTREVAAESPGRLKSRWKVMAEDIIGFYNGVIRAHFIKAEKYLQMLVARVGG